MSTISPTITTMIASRSRRSNMEVKIDVLQAIFEGVGRPTHIMNRTNLSWATCRSFIKSLEELGLVSGSDVKGRKDYALTEKGGRVVETYANLTAQAGFLQLIAPVRATRSRVGISI
jgi:predicted transcriptional regulator